MTGEERTEIVIEDRVGSFSRYVDQVAQAAGVNPRLVQLALGMKESDPALAERVWRGEIAASEAFEALAAECRRLGA